MSTTKESEDLDLDSTSNQEDAAYIPIDLPIRTLKEVEFLHIMHVMFHYSGNRTRVAKAVGFSIRTLRNKLNEYKKDRNISFPMTGCSTMSRAEFRYYFLNVNKLQTDEFDFPEVAVAEKVEQILVTEFGFPSYLINKPIVPKVPRFLQAFAENSLE
jgi:hypothetical protein